MVFRINDVVFDFIVDIDQGEILFYDWIGDSWVILFFYLKDFMLVCMIEFFVVVQLVDEWVVWGIKVIGVFVDGVDDYKKWKEDIVSYGNVFVGFLIIVDVGLKVLKFFDMLLVEVYLFDGWIFVDSVIVCFVFIIGFDKQLKLLMIYLMIVGWNFVEILCVLDGLQMLFKGVVMLVNWVSGEDVIILLIVFNEDVVVKFGEFEMIFFYLWKMKVLE